MGEPLPLNSYSVAGVHVLLELYGVEPALLTDEDFIRTTLLDGIAESQATVLMHHFHHFGEDCGVTGVILLSESHCTIHTWPEREYAAIDIFMCGNCDPMRAVPVVIDRFRPSRLPEVKREVRGIFRDL